MKKKPSRCSFHHPEYDWGKPLQWRPQAEPVSEPLLANPANNFDEARDMKRWRTFGDCQPDPESRPEDQLKTGGIS